MKKIFAALIIPGCLALTFQNAAQERPDPGDAPTFIPGPPPSSAEIEPFPSNTEGELALVAFLYDPKNARIILSVDSRSNAEFVLQSSSDLNTWQNTDQSITGNRSIITFYVPLSPTGGFRYYRVRKI